GGWNTRVWSCSIRSTTVFASWSTFQEILDQPQTVGLALLRVKLGAYQVVAPDDRRDLAAVIDGGESYGRIGADHVVGVHEVEMGAVAEPFQNRMRTAGEPQLVPAHVRHLERGVAGLQRPHFRVDPAEPLRLA